MNGARPRPSRPHFLYPGNPGYDEARAVWNAMHDRRPVCVARCRTAEEVSDALRFAVANGHPVTVRGGGHNVAGAAVADDAVMIDLSPMRGVLVDAGARVAYADGGCLLRDVDAATVRYGLACPAGVVSHTGLGGLALGGGYGWLARTWGPTCDHILAAQVVLADGSIVEADETGHPELLWALRGGGGGNFGVVTRFTLRLRPVGPLYHHVAQYPLETAARALAAYRSFAEHQPDTLHVVGALKRVPAAADGGGVVLRLGGAYFGDPQDGPRRIAPLLDAAPPETATGRVISYLELQGMGDLSEPHGHRYYTKSGYLTGLPDEAVASMLSGAQEMPSTLSSIDFEYLRGAIARPPERDGAFPNRDAPYIVTASAQWTDPAHDEENVAWTRRAVHSLSGPRMPGAYVNYVQDEEWAPPDIYGEQRLRRLAAVKRVYDPDDVLRGGRIPAAARPTTSASEGT
ncbi:oxidoreductase [Sphaerisporangium siamense]|uniref:FAD/FMN-containing dehydrogenase n=1 Tax=Sphaerisporangium siamense TaxID=795645 RepID=A0A7W7D3G0_9ACTN|nr:FAD-dependent oxidoreductase [Sphaerisporangium siamense]MBB4699572.1 FAD/FMN-containing dehydrogenase [Sphaerisporangium siamense]GII86988.1 oxidoreductase [Sphaerisporangium siamense]